MARQASHNIDLQAIFNLKALACSFEILEQYEFDRQVRAMVVAQSYLRVADNLRLAMSAWNEHEEVVESICRVMCEAARSGNEAMVESLGSLVALMSEAFVHTHYACMLKCLLVLIGMAGQRLNRCGIVADCIVLAWSLLCHVQTCTAPR